MHHLKYQGLLIALSVIILCSCYDENNALGKDLVNSKFRNVLCDSSTIAVTAVRLDSVDTSGKNLALVGKYEHPLWGIVTSSSFIPYKHPSYTTDALTTVVFDSIMLQLSHTGYSVGDTTAVQRFTVHQLKEKIRLNKNGYLYSNHTVPYHDEPLAAYSYKPAPNSREHKNISVRLPDELGQDLLTRLHNRDDNVSEDRFEDYFKGIVILPDSNISRSIVAFSVKDTLASIDLHYHMKGEVENGQILRILPGSERQFNHFNYNRTGTSMEAVTDEASSTQLGGKGVIMGGVGWYSRLEFPYLNEIAQQGRIINVEEASLKIYPDINLYSSLTSLPDSIFLFVADENHVVTEVVKDYLGKQVQSGILIKDEYLKENTYYYFDITTFMQTELNASGRFKHNLQLMFNEKDYTNTFKSLTFRDQQDKFPITLLLTYKIYESH